MGKIYQSPEVLQEQPLFHIPFWQMPATDVFAVRAVRFGELAAEEMSGWRQYLSLLAKLTQAQQVLLDGLPEIVVHKTAHDNVPLPLSLLADNHLVINHLFTRLHALLKADLSPTAQLVWDELCSMSEAKRYDLCLRVLQQSGLLTDHDYAIWVHALLQIVWTKAARQLTVVDVPQPDDTSYCPCCGSDAVGSVILNHGELEGVRYLQCNLCNSRWHILRAQCTFCSNSKDMGLQNIEGADEGALSAAYGECCPHCHHYRKLYRLDKQQFADPIADDLATLAVDMLLADDGYERGGANPYLILDKPIAN